MKSFFYISVLLFTVTISAQKAVVKEIGYNHQYLEILLQDIDLLEIVHTDEQKISISMKDYPENPTQLEIKNSDDLINLSSINRKSID